MLALIANTVLVCKRWAGFRVANVYYLSNFYPSLRSYHIILQVCDKTKAKEKNDKTIIAMDMDCIPIESCTCFFPKQNRTKNNQTNKKLSAIAYVM